MDFLHFISTQGQARKQGRILIPYLSLNISLYFSDKTCLLGKNPVANQANIFLLVSTPTYMGRQGVSPPAACPVPAVGSGCGWLRCLCPAGSVPLQTPDMLLPIPWLRERWRRQCWLFLCVSQILSSGWCSLIKTIPRSTESIHFSKIIWREMPLAFWELTQVGRHGQEMTKGRFMTAVSISVILTS